MHFRRLLSFVAVFLFASSLHAGSFAYVVNSTDGEVIPVNLYTEQVGVPIPVGPNPQFITITPDSSTAFVTQDGSVVRIDLATNNVVATVTDSRLANSVGIVIDATGTTAYVSTANGNVVYIDIASNTVITSVPVAPGDVLRGIDISQNGMNLFVVDVTAKQIIRVNIVSQTTTTLFIGGTLDSIVVIPGTSKVYVTDTSGNRVVPFDTETFTLGTDITGFSDPKGIAVSADGSTAYVVNSDYYQQSIATGTNTPGATSTGPSCLAGQYNATARVVGVAVASTANVMTATCAAAVVSIPAAGGALTNIPVAGAMKKLVGIVISSIGTLGPIAPPAPQNASACQVKNVFLTQTERFNRISWQAPSPSTAVVSYKIFRDAALTSLVGTVEAEYGNSFTFEDHQSRNTNTYYIVSVDANGVFSTPTKATVNGNCK